jgi:ribosomal protein L27
MCKSLQALVATVAVFGLIAASVRLAVAQQADDSEAGIQILVSPSAVLPAHRIKESLLDVAGCWSGEIDDDGSLAGEGFIFFVQKGKKAVKGTDVGGMIGATTFFGSIEGKVTVTSFFLKAKDRKCHVSFIGRMPNEALVGSFSFKNCGSPIPEGTFVYDFDPTGESCTP